MKKYLFIISSVILLLSFSISSLAISNEYTFSDIWNKTAFSKSYIIANDTNYSADLTYAPSLVLNNCTDDFNLGYQDSVSFSGISFDKVRSSSFDVSIPFNVSVGQYNELNYTLYLLLPGNYTLNLSSLAVLSDSTTVSVSSTLTKFTSGKLVSYVLNSFGGIDGTTTIYDAASVYQIDLYLDPSSNITINYLNLGISLGSDTGSFVLGALGSTELTLLPDSVEFHLNSISSKINLTNQRILSLITDLRLTNSKIDEILAALSSASASTTVLTQFLQTPTEDQTEVTEKLEQLVEEAKEELEEIKEVLTSVPAPTYSDIISSNSDGVNSATYILNSDDTTQLFNDVFTKFPFLTGIILSVLALASISYILYGKK